MRNSKGTSESDQTTSAREPTLSRPGHVERRGTLARVAATVGPTIVGTCILIVAIEATLRMAGFERPVPLGGDPFVNLTPFFHTETAPDGTRVVRHGDRTPFLAIKPANGFRVFVLGESSVEGVPYGPQYAFAAYLERRLRAALPQRKVEVVNCGVSAIGSWHLRRIAREVVAYQPDLVLVYAGHNDFMVRYVPEPSWVVQHAARMRVLQLTATAGQRLRVWREGPLRQGLATASAQPFLLARLRATGASTLTIAERRRIRHRFADDLRSIVTASRAAGAVPVVASLVQNLRDWPPGGSRHAAALPARLLTRWNRLVATGHRRRAAGDCAGALAAYAAAARVDDQFAELHYWRARCLEAVGAWDRARVEYRRASDLDAVPMGAPTSLNHVIRRTTESAGGMFVPLARPFERASAHGIPGDDVFVDYVHPNLRGNQRIAAILAGWLRMNGIPVAPHEWTDGGYVDPDPDALACADPSIPAREHLIRAVCLLLVGRADDAVGRPPARDCGRVRRE